MPSLEAICGAVTDGYHVAGQDGVFVAADDHHNGSRGHDAEERRAIPAGRWAAAYRGEQPHAIP